MSGILMFGATVGRLYIRHLLIIQFEFVSTSKCMWLKLVLKHIRLCSISKKLSRHI